MTVAELIEALQKMPQNLDVVCGIGVIVNAELLEHTTISGLTDRVLYDNTGKEPECLIQCDINFTERLNV